MPAIVTPLENRRAVIAFARRLADHVSLGAREIDALPIIAEQLRATGYEADRQIADAARTIVAAMQEGYLGAAWEPQVGLFGDHLVSLVSTAYLLGANRLTAALYAGADTLESDIRTGYSL